MSRGLALLLALVGGLPLQAATPAPSFAERVGPLLQARCVRCHGGTRARGGLDLSRRDGLLAGGTRGPAIVPGKAQRSLLFEMVREHKMPPRQPLADEEVDLLRRWIDAGAVWHGPALVVPAAQPARIANREAWSLRPIRRTSPPSVSRPEWVRNPVDAFILARLEQEEISPSPEVDRRTYMRRVSLDLTGLLPTPEEIDAFVADASVDAYERLVDRLLSSSPYGERWGRHWLDVVHFAESHGYEMNTLRQSAWPYRDYVIRAFNRDIPYPQFVLEQLAGDTVADADFLSRAATGFLVSGAHDMVGNATREGQMQQRMDDLFDIVSTTSATFLGLTVGCARCHDHKFDPIAQKDYYRLQAVFAGVEHAEREIAGAEEERQRQAMLVRAECERLDGQLDQLELPAGKPASAPCRPAVDPHRNVERLAPVEARFVRFTVLSTIDHTEPCIDELEVHGPSPEGGNLALAGRGARPSASSVYANSPLHRIEHLNDGRLGNGRSWISRERGQGWAQVELPRVATIDRIVWGRDREGKYQDRLPRDYRIEVSVDGRLWKVVAGSWDRYSPGHPIVLSEEVRKLRQARQQAEERLRQLEKSRQVYAGAFHAPEATRVLLRGDPMQPREEVEPGAVVGIGPRLRLSPRAGDGERRRALAEWITSPDNPLPARVMVNRIWQWHFGQGLVRTPSDFGANGDTPSHPELLDWLARQYQAGGWRLKPLHRLIVLSSTYRQGARPNARAAARDAGNRLLWSHPPRRLEAEVIRDTLLQVSGMLDRRMGGPGYHLWDYSGYVIVFKPKAVLGPDALRRMIYQFKPRLQQDGTFGVFDCPDATTTLPRRNRSTTPLQALNLLNDPFVLEQAEHFAARLQREAGSDPSAQVDRAFRLAFGRHPSLAEARAAGHLVEQHGLAVFCRALFNANELVFVD
jgi:hypothetical protein